MPNPNPSFDMNSVWLEGTALGCAVATHDDRGQPVFRFRVATSRCFRLAADTSVFTVEIPARAGPEVLPHVSRGRGLRVVGQLRRGFRRDIGNQNTEDCTIVGQLVVPRVRAATG